MSGAPALEPRTAPRRNAVAGLALSLLAAAACATARTPDRIAVRKLEFRGNRVLGDAELRAHLLTGSPPWQPWKARPEFDETLLVEDMLRLRKLYGRHGYFEASAEYALRWSESRTAVAIEVRIEEGPAVRLSRWSVDLDALPGGAEAWRAQLLEGLPLREGSVFSLDGYEGAKRALRDRLANAGFPRAMLQGGAEVDAAQRSAGIAWRVEPGPRVRFGETAVRGLQNVEEALVRRELAYQAGETYSARALRESERRVYDLGLFQSVSLRARPEGEPAEAPAVGEQAATWPVEVEVIERPPRSVRTGIGYGSEEGVRALVGWQRRNFLGQARLLDLSARYSALLQGVEARLEQPRFLDGRFALLTSGKLEREHAASFDADRARAHVSLTRPLFGAWKGSLGYALERDDVTDVSRSTERTLDDPQEIVLLSYLELGVERKTVTGGLEPKGGSSLTLGLQFSPAYLGADYDYLKSVADWRVFLPVGGGVLALRLRAGSIQPLATTKPDELPLVVRFFSGGSNSVRGFAYQELGPLDARGEPLGGASLAEGSVELRFPLWRRLGGVVFLDAGQVDRQPFHWKFDQVFYSTGTGLRYDTPIGPLRVDFGWVLNPEEDVDRFRVHFAVGHAF